MAKSQKKWELRMKTWYCTGCVNSPKNGLVRNAKKIHFQKKQSNMRVYCRYYGFKYSRKEGARSTYNNWLKGLWLETWCTCQSSLILRAQCVLSNDFLHVLVQYDFVCQLFRGHRIYYIVGWRKIRHLLLFCFCEIAFFFLWLMEISREKTIETS
jgi:hypothetical protein